MHERRTGGGEDKEHAARRQPAAAKMAARATTLQPDAPVGQKHGRPGGGVVQGSGAVRHGNLLDGLLFFIKNLFIS
jgi:hypothetical protein